MCVALPARVLEVTGMRGVVDIAGTRRTVSLVAVPEVAPGDCVLVSMGLAVEVISEDEARALEGVWAELAAAEQKDSSSEEDRR